MSNILSVGATARKRTTSYVEEEGEDGLWQARLTYVCPWSTRSTWMPANGTASPYNAALLKVRGTVEMIKTGTHARLTCFYKGYSGSLPSNYGEFVPGRTEAPIQTHPNFKTVLAGTPSAPLNGAFFDPDNNNAFVKFKEILDNGDLNSKAGISTYNTTSPVWRYHLFSASSDFNLANLDKIYSTVPGSPAPTAPSGRNWLLVDRPCSQQGGIWHTIEDYLLSGPRGWDTDIYATA